MKHLFLIALLALGISSCKEEVVIQGDGSCTVKRDITEKGVKGDKITCPGAKPFFIPNSEERFVGIEDRLDSVEDAISDLDQIRTNLQGLGDEIDENVSLIEDLQDKADDLEESISANSDDIENNLEDIEELQDVVEGTEESIGILERLEDIEYELNEEEEDSLAFNMNEVLYYLGLSEGDFNPNFLDHNEEGREERRNTIFDDIADMLGFEGIEIDYLEGYMIIYRGDIVIARVYLDEDTDGDGLSDWEEIEEIGTDPLKQDTDGDGLSDFEELGIGLDPTRSNVDTDTDEDGIDDLDELERNLDPTDQDTDNDNSNDGEDAFPNQSCASVDTDNDGQPDSFHGEDNDCDLSIDNDDDNDGVDDESDHFPLDDTRQCNEESSLNTEGMYCVSTVRSCGEVSNGSGSQSWEGTQYGSCDISCIEGFVEESGQCLRDSDGDGTSDENDLDADNNGILDSTETEGGGCAEGQAVNPNDELPRACKQDWDADGIVDEIDTDADGDRVLDTDDDALFNTSSLQSCFANKVKDQEATVEDPKPCLLDTDNDAVANKFDHDDDNDGLNDSSETLLGTDPLIIDTDGDGFNDKVEFDAGTDGTDPNSFPVDE